jgi:periplasmic protein TonB
MSALALHAPQRRGVARWTLAAAAIVAVHAMAVAAVALWYERTPPEANILPAIAVSFEPQAAVQPQSNDALAQQQSELHEATPEPPKVEEEKVEQPPEQLMPPPPAPAEITLPKPEPKRVEKKPVQEKRQEAHAVAAPAEATRRASVAASNAYNSLVVGHLQRFKRAIGPIGQGEAFVRFVLDRNGRVLSSAISKSSGNAALDREALALVSRANPFPAFPPEKAAQKDTDSFNAPIRFEPGR